MIRPPPRSPLFPYTTLFRSLLHPPRQRLLALIEPVDVLALARELPLELAELDVASHRDRKSTRLNSSHVRISYAVFCLKKKNEDKERKTPLAEDLNHIRAFT